MRPLALLATLHLLFLAAPGCDTEGPQGCDLTSCIERAGGFCEANGYCSYPEEVSSCGSGLRWGSDALGELEGACVRAEPASECGCEDDGLECTRERCAAGRCVRPPDYDGNRCVNGVCYDGACCAGCWNGEQCQTGDTVSACGYRGKQCRACPVDDGCTTYSCDGWCYGEPLGGPGCPPCGGLDDPCCAGDTCDGNLTCTATSCGEDCIEERCE